MPRIRATKSFKLENGLLVEENVQTGTKGAEQHEDIDEIDLSNWMTPPESPDHTLYINTALSCKLDRRGMCSNPGHNSQCKHSRYGKPMIAKHIKEIMQFDNVQGQEGGLIWNATIIPDGFDANFVKDKSLNMLSVNHYDTKNKCIKPRRGNLAVTKKDFFSSIVPVSDKNGQNHWVFSGVLNGWPGLTCLELIEIEYSGPIPAWMTFWEKNYNSKPEYPNNILITEVRAKLRAPSWTAFGWSRESPGYFFWYECASQKIPRVLYGTNIIKEMEREKVINGKSSPKCVKVHMVSHRYSVGDNENAKDKITYHSLALLEWDHGEYMTVAEVGFLNGLSGSYGRSNWIEDKLEEVTSLFKCMPPEMVAPWRNKLCEIRCSDIKAKSLDEFLQYMKRHTGTHKRFLDVHHTFSHDVRLSFNSREHIAQYLINYVRRGRSYSELSRNCQTFSADFCAFLAGKRDVQPFHIVNRIDYKNHAYHFLYEGEMYPKRTWF